MFALFLNKTTKPNIFVWNRVGIKEISRECSVEKRNALPFQRIPGPKSYPVIGTLYKYLPFIGEYKTETLDKNAWLNWQRYGILARERPGINLLNVYDPDLIEKVFRQDGRLPARRSHEAMKHYRLSKPHVYNTGGLLSTNGEEWWRLRSAFQKSFSSPNIKHHVNDTDQIAQEFVQWMRESKVTSNDDFLNYLNRLNLEAIGKVAFNERFNSFSILEQNPDSRSTKTIEAAFGSNSGIMKLDTGFLWRIFKTPLYRKLAKSQEYLEKVATEILLNRVTFFEKKADDSDMSILATIVQQSEVDLKDIVGMMVDILMASIDTTAYSTSFALYHLAKNPDCQEKLFEEILSLLPSKESTITADVISKATYLRSCLKESLRLNPVAIGVGRILQKNLVLNGYLIPKNTVILTQNMVASRLPQFVKEPLTFKPERWMRDSAQYENVHPFLSLPFGFGPRSCIARRLAEQNMCITIMRILREYQISWMGRELGIRTFLINKPDQPISLSFAPRSK